jgi:hypothetical protein
MTARFSKRTMRMPSPCRYLLRRRSCICAASWSCEAPSSSTARLSEGQYKSRTYAATLCWRRNFLPRSCPFLSCSQSRASAGVSEARSSCRRVLSAGRLLSLIHHPGASRHPSSDRLPPPRPLRSPGMLPPPRPLRGHPSSGRRGEYCARRCAPFPTTTSTTAARRSARFSLMPAPARYPARRRGAARARRAPCTSRPPPRRS